jgi:hypothetical protein
MTRRAIEDAIEALIALLDDMDGDADREPELDASADDFGEVPGDTWMQPPAICAPLCLTA